MILYESLSFILKEKQRFYNLIILFQNSSIIQLTVYVYYMVVI